MKITIFPNVSATTSDEYDLDWSEIVEQCVNPPSYPTKQDCPLVKLTTFGNIRTPKGSLRHEDNITSVTGVEIDYDLEAVSPFDAASLLQMWGVEAVVYTSASHSSSAPRWRILAPLSTPCDVPTRRIYAARLNTIINGIASRESFASAQSFYIGRVDGVEYECHVSHGVPIDTLMIEPTYPVATSNNQHAMYERRTDADLEELRSALRVIPSDDRDMWVSVGQSLVGLGDEGYALWVEWSATSDKFNIERDTETWNSFTGSRTGFASIFAKAQALGWSNPRARKPLDITGGGFGKGVVSSHSAPCSRPVEGSRFVMAHEADKIFNGCVWVQSLDMMLVPGGHLLNKSRFDAMFGGYTFMVDAANTVKAKTPWEGFLKSQVFDHPKAHDICFRPELPPSVIINEAGLVLVNVWWPVETQRTPGDVSPFLDLISKLLPVERDRSILLAYCAALVQHVGFKFQWCPVIQGAEGNGKSFLSACIEYAIGNKYTHKPNAAELGGNGAKFTGWLRNKLYISIEEVFTAHKRETLDALKPLITNSRIEIQGKGTDQVTGDNRANFLMFTNYKNAIPFDVDIRRYAPFFTAQQSKEDIMSCGMGGSYFPDLYNWARSGGFAHIAHYLATYDIPDEFNPATTCMRAPTTSSTLSAIQTSLGPLEQEIAEVVAEGRPGFNGGFISSIMLDRLLAQRKVSRQRQHEMLTHMGYIKHPALNDGRVNNRIPMPDDGKPRLYVHKDAPIASESSPSVVASAYQSAQSIFGK